MVSAAQWSQLPHGGAPEIADAGRSNAGKSSAINALAQRRKLAFVSKTPGRTQNINFFRLSSGSVLADLPGYGYAAVPATLQRHWQVFVARYLAERASLVGMILVMDARHALAPLDLQMLRWFLPTGSYVHCLLTKADKLSAAEQRRTIDSARRTLASDFGVYAPQISAQLFSATRHVGLEEAERVVASWVAEQKERPQYQGE